MSYKFVRYSQSLAKKPKKQTLFLNCDGADVSFFVLLLFIKLIGTLMKIVPVFLTNKLLKDQRELNKDKQGKNISHPACHIFT